jgi:hypothetical protein
MGGVNLVAGFRPELWRTVAPDDAPSDVAGFNEAVKGIDGFVMPATQHDAVLWLSGNAYDVVFDMAREAITTLDGLASVADETSSWPYQHDRDLTGFIDGTENPSLIDAPDVALIPEGSPGRGGPSCCCRSGPTTRPPGNRCPFPSRKQSSDGRSSTASSLRTRRPSPTSGALIKTASARSFDEICPLEPSRATAPCSRASAPSSEGSSRCLKAWLGATKEFATPSRFTRNLSLGRTTSSPRPRAFGGGSGTDNG